jgi:hypothetical protein
MYNFSHFIQYFVKVIIFCSIFIARVTIFRRDVFSSVLCPPLTCERACSGNEIGVQLTQLAHILPAVASIDPCAQQQKLVKLVLPVEN